MIRPCQPTDLAAIVDIERATFSEPWTLGEYELELSRSCACLWVCHQICAAANSNGVIVAYLDYWQVSDSFEVIRIATAPHAQRQGHATALMKHLLAQAQQAKAASIYLEVRASNAAAIGLYRRCGFVQVGRRARYYRDGEDAIVMQHILNGSAL